MPPPLPRGSSGEAAGTAMAREMRIAADARITPPLMVPALVSLRGSGRRRARHPSPRHAGLYNNSAVGSIAPSVLPFPRFLDSLGEPAAMTLTRRQLLTSAL